MAIVWSAASGGMYIGIEAWVKSGPDASGKVIIHVDYYIEAQSGYTHSWTYPWHWSGTGGSGSQQVTYNSPNAFAPVRQQLPGWDVAVWAEFGRTTTATFNASLGPIWNGGAPSVSATVTVPARPYLVPAAPSSVSVSRVSDTQATVAFAVSSSGSAPVQSIGIERRSLRDPVWRNLVWLDRSTSGSWTDTTLPSNDRFEYRVRTWNASGYSAYKQAPSGVVSTVGAPANVRASKQASGNVLVEWDKTYPGGGTFTVFDNGDQVWETPVGSGPATFLHAASAQETHTYTVRQTDAGVVSPLSSPSNTVQLLAAPNAPKLTAPHGAVQVGQVRLQWIHNPVDSTPQQAATVRYRARGASSWDTRTVQDAQEVTVALPVGSFEWQVQTKGLHASYSPWSAISVFDVVDLPGVTILSPDDGATINRSRLIVEWSYFQAQGNAQTQGQVQVYLGDEMIEQSFSYGSGTSLELSTVFQNERDYTIHVCARSSSGLWSRWTKADIHVSFPAPPQPEVSVSWSEDTGAATVQITNRAPAEGLPAAVSNTVERSINGGASWEPVAANIGLSTTVTDPECLSNGTTLYRVTATSDLPSSSSTTVELTTSSDAIWLSGGQGFALAVPLAWNPKTAVSSGLANRKVHRFAGRRLPVEMSGVQRVRAVSLSATLLDERIDLLDRLEALSYATAPLLYRDPLGRRIYTSLSGLQMDRALGGTWSVSASLEEVDR